MEIDIITQFSNSGILLRKIIQNLLNEHNNIIKQLCNETNIEAKKILMINSLKIFNKKLSLIKELISFISKYEKINVNNFLSLPIVNRCKTIFHA